MDFRILGPLEVLDEGHAITLGGRRQRALLALLLLHANETLSTDRLIDELWGERPPTNAAKTVQMQISRLRKALGWEAGKGSAGLVVTRGSGYQLRLDPERLDAHRFQRLAAEGRGELARGHPERAVLALERALALWRGAPLQELAYEPFAQREVARLDDLQVAALEQLVEAKLALGRHGEVVGELETLIGDHPYRERLRAQLMLALYRCDRQAEALQAYQDARRKLVEELGIEPGERLRELERAILAQDPGLATPEPPVAVAPRERSEPLLEREGPLAAIEEMIESATRSEGSVVAVEAAAGLGKSALLALAGDRAAARGLRVACARGADLERDFPFGIVRQLLEPVVAREAAREGRDPFDGAAGLASPLFRAPQEPVSSERPGTGSLESPGVAMHGLYWLAANLAERGPMLLCVDDLHWGDTASLRWLHYLARRLEGPPFALLVASRPGEAGSDTEVLAAIAAEPITRLVRLEPLSEQASGLFARRALGVPADERFCAACHAVSGGNPFLLGELTGTLAREGVEPTEASVSLVREFVPESVTRALALRLGRLPEAAGALARAVAILGSGPTLHDAAGLAELQEREAARAAAALAAVAILAPGLPLEFVHPLVRTAVYGELPEGERALWHARAGRLLAKGGAPSDRIAAHLLRAEPAGDAWVAERLRAAATDALSRADPHSAIAYLRRAFVEPVPRPERTALVHELVRASFLAMDPTATDGLGLDPLAELAADPDTLQASAVYLAIALWGTGRAQEALTVLDRALSAAMAAGDHDGALRIEVRRIALAQLPPSEALRRLEVFEGQVAPHGFAGRVVDAGLAWYGSLTGSSASETVERCRRAFIGDRLIRELQHDELVLTTFVLALLRTDELDLCERVIERMLAQGRACGSASAVASGSYLSAYLAHLRGDLLRAEADARAAVAAFEVTGIIARVPTQTALLVDVLVDRGEITEAAQEISAADMDGEIPDHWWFGPVVWSRGYLRLAQGKNREGVEELLEFGRRYHRDGLVPTVTRPWASHAAPLLAQQGEHDEARQLAQSELDEAQVWGTPRVIGQAQRGLALVIGGSEGIELLHEAVRTLESSPARLEHARALIDLGAALRRRNRRRDAREPLRCGLELAHRCGVRLLAARAAEELRATGAKPRRLVVTGVDALTPSERRIAEMTAEGLTNREIAQALFVTVKTVETHMGHIFRKLDVHARGQLAPLLHDSVNQPSKPSLALRSR
jgi:DNA-binding SARP family transcriptional activator/DNA-binding CsgD family transcriptional regulator